jgi:hypothetical protein
MKEMFEKKKEHVKLWLLTDESTLNHSRDPQKHWYKEHQYFVCILNLLKCKGLPVRWDKAEGTFSVLL